MDMEQKEDLSLLLHKQGCLIKILVWLPVVSLLGCKTVNRFWRNLIQSPLFTDLYTTLNSDSSSSSEFSSFILPVIYDGFYHPLLMVSTSQSDDSKSFVLEVDDLGFDMNNKRIVGSCNGLVCLHDRKRGPKAHGVSLWNPVTRQSLFLPESKTVPGGVSSLVVFGYDLETKDYKVVQFTWLKPRWNGNGPENCFCGVQVYSLSTGSWRLLEGIPCLPGYPYLYPDSALYLNGTCFFLAHFFYTERYPCLVENNRFIISFDFTKEIITPIQLPDHHKNQVLCLCSLGDNHKIALFTSPNPENNCEDFNIWVLNYERGSSSSSSVNKNSWTKLHSFQIQLESPVFKGQLHEAPIGISNDGKFALLTSEYGNKMNLYNFATKEVKRDFLVCGNVMSKAHAYKPSLVSVLGGNGAGSSSSQSQWGSL